MAHIEISYSGIERSDALDETVRAQLERAAGRHFDRITRFEVHLADTNAHKKGAGDRRCRVEARPRGLDPILAEDEGDDMYTVVKRAAEKISRALTRRFEKLDEYRESV